MIAAFRKLKGDHFVPPLVHKSIRWSASNPYIEDTIIETDQPMLDEKGGNVKRRTSIQLSSAKSQPSHISHDQKNAMNELSTTKK